MTDRDYFMTVFYYLTKIRINFNKKGISNWEGKNLNIRNKSQLSVDLNTMNYRIC